MDWPVNLRVTRFYIPMKRVFRAFNPGYSPVNGREAERLLVFLLSGKMFNDLVSRFTWIIR
jgi:hypothetical protein